jgi:VanZ like family.
LHGSEHLLNLVLFMPFAFFAVLAVRRIWPVLVVVIAVSGLVEALQSATGRGTCESGDVFRNALGG